MDRGMNRQQFPVERIQAPTSHPTSAIPPSPRRQNDTSKGTDSSAQMLRGFTRGEPFTYSAVRHCQTECS
jgi:hypothetical protein